MICHSSASDAARCAAALLLPFDPGTTLVCPIAGLVWPLLSAGGDALARLISVSPDCRSPNGSKSLAVAGTLDHKTDARSPEE